MPKKTEAQARESALRFLGHSDELGYEPSDMQLTSLTASDPSTRKPRRVEALIQGSSDSVVRHIGNILVCASVQRLEGGGGAQGCTRRHEGGGGKNWCT